MNLSTSVPPAIPSTSTALPQPATAGPPSPSQKLHEVLLAKFVSKGIPNADVTVYRDFVLQHDALLEVPELKKCNRTAVQIREAGNRLFLEKKYDEALEKYNESICFAEFNSEHLGMGYANRSAVYFDQDEYEFALYNIMLARKHNFPEELRSQLLQREINCREKIIGGQSKIAGQVPPSSRIGLNVEVNGKLPFVAKGITMKYYPEFGRGLVSERDFNTGDVILDEKPMLMAVEHGLRYSVCSYCTAAFRRSLIPCPNCVSCMYCSEKCLEMDHRFTHRFECGIMERLRNASFNTTIITSRLFFYGLTLFGDNPQLMMKSCWDTFNSGGNPFDLDYTQYDPLEEFKTMHKVKFRLPKANIEHHYRMCAALHYAVFMKHPLVQSLVVGKTYQGFMLQCLLNYARVVFFLMKDTVVDSRDRVVSFLSPIATVFNHSCDPNVLIIPRASRIVAVTLRPVRKGEQLTSSYGPTWWDIPNLPLTFDCRCVVCVMGKKGFDWCPPGRQLPQEAIRDLKRVCDLADDVARLNAAQQFIQRYTALYPEANLGGMVKLFNMLLVYVTCCETDARDQMRDFAETAMNDILGWYGYGDSVDRIDIAASSSSTAATADSTHHPRHKDSNSGSSTSLKSKHNNKAQQQQQHNKPSRQFNMLQHQQQQQHNSGDSDSIAPAAAASGVTSPAPATIPSKTGVLVSPGSTNSSSNINNSSSTIAAETRNGVNLREQQQQREHGQGGGESSTSEKDSSRESSKSPMLVKMLEKQEPICAWCRRGVPPNQTGCIAGTTEGTIFCSESCFSQSRRASFKRAKTCDWCRHVRHAVSYVDFQDGVTQLQFCSDKCLNQYKMQIFCNETQAHLDMNPHLKEKSSSAGSLITPDLWLKNCKSRSASPLSDRSESVSPTPSLPMRPSPEPSPVMQSPPTKKPMISVAPPSKLLSKNLQHTTPVNARSVIKSTRKRRPGLRPLQQNTLHTRRVAKVDYGHVAPCNNNNSASVHNNNLPTSSMPKPATVTSANIQDLRVGVSLQKLSHSMTSTKFESRESPTTPRPPPLNIPPQFLQLPPNPAMRPPFFPLNPAFRFGSPPNHPSMPPPPPPNMDPNNPQNRSQPPLLGFPAPPVTILVPYPIVIPLPLPIPIPIPLIDFLKATAPKEEAKPEPTNACDSPVSTTEQPASSSLKEDSISDPDLEPPEDDEFPLDFTVSQNRLQHSYTLEPVKEPVAMAESEAVDRSPEQRLPKFRITRLSDNSSKRVEMESEEELQKDDAEDLVERSRPLRKRKRLVGHQEEVVPSEERTGGVRGDEAEGTKG